MNTSAINLGQCWGMTPDCTDLASPSYMASGVLCVAQAVARRWSTSFLINDPTYGRNLFDHISDDLTPAQIAQEQQALRAQALLDQRVQTMTVTLTLVNGVLTCTGSGTTAAGPFSLVGTASQFSPLSFQVQV
jgi:hypothetical protein